MARAKKKRRKKRRRSKQGDLEAPVTHRAARFGVFVTRVYTGLVFLDAIEYKLLAKDMPFAAAVEHFVTKEYTELVQRCVEHPASIFGWRMDGYASFLEHVMLHDSLRWWFAVSILVFETLLGLTLVLGLWTRVMATLGALLMVAFGLAKAMYIFSLSGDGSNWLLTVMLANLALLHAGHYFGLDGRFRPGGWGWRPLAYAFGLTVLGTLVLRWIV